MKEVFGIVEGPHVLRNELKLKSRKINSLRYGIETAYFVGAVWSSLPSDLKQCKSLNLFKSKIKSWIPENCPCKLCKTYLQRIGYVQISNEICFLFFMTVRFRKESTCPVTPGM